MPRRRLLALLPVLLVAGCEIDIGPGAIPPPISIAPIPSASAGVPKYVCSAAYKILTEGAVRLASALPSGDAALRRTFEDMAAQLDAERARTSDPALRDALQAVSDDLTAGAAQPRSYLDGDFTTVGQKLDGACG
ncbi:hypothetical protein [Actinoplanes sp. URMC 104]|uniref:hypothetical protein n=1 Tax=Actinoplanes sp. URMC 104 TaxID=3423409 RepID=UPI003F1A0914